MKLPRRKRLAFVDRGVAEVAVVRADQLGPVVTDEIEELWRLVADRVEHLVSRPMLVEPGRARILVNEGGRAGKSGGENIWMLVAVEIVNPAEEMIGVAFDRLRLGGEDLLPGGEVGPLEPIGTIDRVDHAIAVDVADVRAPRNSKRP